MTPADANAACDAYTAAMRTSTGAAIRLYQTQVDAYLKAGQDPPPPPPELEGKIRVIDGQVYLIKSTPTTGRWPAPIPTIAVQGEITE
jgi:hypothetical protein